MDLSFYKNKKVLITGHTGFKGSWMCKILSMQGADVIGYSLEPPTNPNLFELAGIGADITSVYGDVRDLTKLNEVFDKFQPEIVIHMAAQPIVRESFRNPVLTYDVNVMGTVNVLECVRNSSSVRSFLNVTTDKVYKNREWEWGYRENEELNGFDPYSNSKSCSELVTSSYVSSFLGDSNIAVSTARAGNVIGGGDFAMDRIIPDCVRNAVAGNKIIVRNPNSVRPYQHVLEPVAAYLLIAKEQYLNMDLAGNYNIGPRENDCLTTGELATLFCKKWNNKNRSQVEWITENDNGPHEANYLKLDCSHVKHVLQWSPRWDADKAVDASAEWYSAWKQNQDVGTVMEKQINEYLYGTGETDVFSSNGNESDIVMTGNN